MSFGEPHPFPEREAPTILSVSGQQRQEGWSCRTESLWNTLSKNLDIGSSRQAHSKVVTVLNYCVMKAYGGMEEQIHICFMSTLDRSEWSGLWPSCFTSR